MNQNYPDRWHPVYMIEDALNAMGIRTDFARDERTLNCWGLIFPDYDNRVLVWLIDNRLPHEMEKEDVAAKELLSRGALVCHAQKPDAERVGGHWLPLVASPGFGPVNVAKTTDVAFVGYVRDEGRARLLADVGHKFKLSINQGLFGVKTVEAYCGAKVGLNIVSHYGQPFAYDSWNMRSPEIMACGVPLVLERQDYLIELGLVNGLNCFMYGGNTNVTDAIRWAVNNQMIDIGASGLQLIRDRHTYKHRAEQVIQWLSE